MKICNENFKTVFIWLVLFQVTSSSSEHEKNIRQKILTNYNADIRPGVDQNRSVNVSFELKLQTIYSYNIKNQVLTIRAFNLLKWLDDDLAWNKTDYNNISKISVDSSLIWTPDVVLYNTVIEESFGHTDIYKSKIAVHHNGLCVWNAPSTWKVSCKSDITWFPIDTQTCDLAFGSWSYTKSQIVVGFRERPTEKKNIKSDLLYVDSGEWEVLDIAPYEKDVMFPCCQEPFTVVIYTLVLRRLYLYYFMYVILPFVSLSFLCLFVYHIPPESGERMGFGVTILLSITVYLLVISEKLPEKSDEKPMIGLIFIIVFYMLCFAVIQALITMILSYRTTKPPEFLSKLIRCCCFGRKKVDMAEEYMDARPVRRKNNKEEKHTPENNIEWKKITRFFDNLFYVVYLLLLISIPFIVVKFLPDYVQEKVLQIREDKAAMTTRL